MEDCVAFKTKTIPDFFAYRIGTDGTLWSCWERRHGKKTPGNRRRWVLGSTWHKQNPGVNSRGYRQALLCPTMGKKRRIVKVANLVLEAFRGPRPRGLIVCHHNDQPTDDRLENLRWDTPASNTHDAVRNGVHPVGRKNGQTKRAAKKYPEIVKLRKSGATQRQIESALHVSYDTVKKALGEYTWRPRLRKKVTRN